MREGKKQGGGVSTIYDAFSSFFPKWMEEKKRNLYFYHSVREEVQGE